jgi:hypothetical protein
MHPLTYDFVYHVDLTTLADGDYEVILDQEVEVSEDPGNTVGDLTEIPNQSSKNLDTTAPNLTQEGKPGHNPYFITLQLILFISFYALRS